jgi:hypothetical protein
LIILGTKGLPLRPFLVGLVRVCLVLGLSAALEALDEHAVFELLLDPLAHEVSDVSSSALLFLASAYSDHRSFQVAGSLSATFSSLAEDPKMQNRAVVAMKASDCFASGVAMEIIL